MWKAHHYASGNPMDSGGARVPTLKLKQQDFAAKQGIKLHGELKDRKGSEGICHSIVLESYALPGQLNIGSDSHLVARGNIDQTRGETRRIRIVHFREHDARSGPINLHSLRSVDG